MNESSFAFLRELLNSPGPSGFEQRPSRVWRDRAKAIADEVTRDVLGNSYARLANPGRPVAVIEGHIDEIGFMITHVDEQGYLWFDRIGGWDIQVLLGQRVLILGTRGDVVGVIGRKAAHILEDRDKDRVPPIRELWIDIGAANREEALERVQVGDPAVLDADFRQLTDDRIASRSLDNRVGAYVALETLRLLGIDRPGVDAFALAATQEETSFAGAFTATYSLRPTVAVVLDVTHATDYPGADKRLDGEITIGGGPVLSRGASLNLPAYHMIRETAEREGIPYQLQGAPRSSGTDADAIIKVASGVATVLVSIPNRYMHSPNELVSLSDLEQSAKLIAAFIRTIDETTDFRP
jgi:endoglucanase